MVYIKSYSLWICAVTNPLSNTRFIYNAALRGAGDSRFTAISTFLGILVVRPLLAYVLVSFFNMDLVGVWIALVSDALLCYALGKWRWSTGKWATIKVNKYTGDRGLYRGLLFI